MLEGLFPELFNLIADFILDAVDPDENIMIIKGDYEDIVECSFQYHNAWVPLTAVCKGWKKYFDEKIRRLRIRGISSPFPSRVPNLEIILTTYLQIWERGLDKKDIFDICHSVSGSLLYENTVYGDYPKLTHLCIDSHQYILEASSAPIIGHNKPHRFFAGRMLEEHGIPNNKVHELDHLGQSLHATAIDLNFKDHKLCNLLILNSFGKYELPRELYELSACLIALATNQNWGDCKIFSLSIIKIWTNGVDNNGDIFEMFINDHMNEIETTLIKLFKNGLKFLCGIPAPLFDQNNPRQIIDFISSSYFQTI